LHAKKDRRQKREVKNRGSEIEERRGAGKSFRSRDWKKCFPLIENEGGKEIIETARQYRGKAGFQTREIYGKLRRADRIMIYRSGGGDAGKGLPKTRPPS